MKRFILFSIFIVANNISFSQDSSGSGKFRRDNIFLGGGIGLGYSSGGYQGSSFNFGITPEIGYTVAQWLDVGISTNLNYYSYAYNDGVGDIKQKSFNYGGGVFLRAYPFESFFLQVLPEYNWIDTKLSYSYTAATQKFNQHATSLLVGIGYGRRLIGETNFFTVLMLDVASEAGSPYRDGYNQAIPILRGGFNFYLRPKRKK